MSLATNWFLFSPNASGDPVLGMPPPIRRHPVLQVDAAPIDMERRSIHRCRDGPCDGGHACVYHVLPGGAFELRKGSTQPCEERVIVWRYSGSAKRQSTKRLQIQFIDTKFEGLWARHQTCCTQQEAHSAILVFCILEGSCFLCFPFVSGTVGYGFVGNFTPSAVPRYVEVFSDLWIS